MWSLIIIVSLKYSILVLRADYKGKGGAFALVLINFIIYNLFL